MKEQLALKLLKHIFFKFVSVCLEGQETRKQVTCASSLLQRHSMTIQAKWAESEERHDRFLLTQ